jgi:hypothetical protein
MITKSYPANVGAKHQSINQSINQAINQSLNQSSHITISRDGHHTIAEETVT